MTKSLSGGLTTYSAFYRLMLLLWRRNALWITSSSCTSWSHYVLRQLSSTAFVLRLNIIWSRSNTIQIRASADVFWRGKKRLVTDQQDVNVFEYCDGWAPSKHIQGFGIDEGGNIWAQAFVTNGPNIAGEVACVELQLKNHSLNWEALKFTDTVTEVGFRGQEYMVPPGIEGVANLVINIPRSSRGSHGGACISKPLGSVQLCTALYRAAQHPSQTAWSLLDS
ncbi:hypothetical protein DEU56DRAFT_924392 [Suillus clintonianus]|uniref:uncharacterized protein n=1 Tax=Suillus clintonianus TaxID=1904413 RepID=UPI001B861561|nr:uncharacterized protein DEU56DRAFT_924392 [Suillus clintonianus]KAG2123440.1 hypothetical protein DEU56DRAFT_924392 [Suillus clintonianus]